MAGPTATVRITEWSACMVVKISCPEPTTGSGPVCAEGVRCAQCVQQLLQPTNAGRFHCELLRAVARRWVMESENSPGTTSTSAAGSLPQVPANDEKHVVVCLLALPQNKI